MQTKFKSNTMQNFFHGPEMLMLSLHPRASSKKKKNQQTNKKNSFYVLPNLNSSLKSVKKRFTPGKIGSCSSFQFKAMYFTIFPSLPLLPRKLKSKFYSQSLNYASFFSSFPPYILLHFWMTQDINKFQANKK